MKDRSILAAHKISQRLLDVFLYLACCEKSTGKSLGKEGISPNHISYHHGEYEIAYVDKLDLIINELEACLMHPSYAEIVGVDYHVSLGDHVEFRIVGTGSEHVVRQRSNRQPIISTDSGETLHRSASRDIPFSVVRNSPEIFAKEEEVSMLQETNQVNLRGMYPPHIFLVFSCCPRSITYSTCLHVDVP